MSKQEDVELIFYYASEMYAMKHHLTKDEVLALFKRSYVFEHILSQHEYLHQVSCEEIVEYIESIAKEDRRSLVLYHGTTDVFDEIVLTKSANRRDFGTGFYTTVIQSQALEWASRLAKRRHVLPYYVYEYVYVESDLLKVLRFSEPSGEWLDFVKDNRIKGGCYHDYDVVIGPVADDKTMLTLQLYVAGVMPKNAAIEELRYSLVNNQVSFHTKRAVEHLKLSRRKQYD